MFDESNPPDDRETIDALMAANIGAMNGIACLIIVLRKRGLIDAKEIGVIQDMIAKPLDDEYLASNRVAQGITANIATMFSDLA